MDLSISPLVALKGVYRRNSIFVVGGTLEQIMNTVVGSEGFLGGIWGREWVGFGLVAAGGGVGTTGRNVAETFRSSNHGARLGDPVQKPEARIG